MHDMNASRWWKDFWRAVGPKDAPPLQYQEMRRAFYAGIWQTLCAARSLGDDGVSEQAGVAALEPLDTECRAFQEAMKKGQA